jgi:hypothetical protein
MRLEESLAIKKIISKDMNNFDIAINLGSGNVNDLNRNKPWIEKNVFFRFKKVIHVDFTQYDSVNIVGDLRDLSIYPDIKKITGKKIFFLCNVLEHVRAKDRKKILNNIYQCMNLADRLIISVPYDYPYHADPIDSLYRPSAEAISREISIRWKNKMVIKTGHFICEFKRMSLFKKIRRLLKPFWILQKPSSYLHHVHSLFYLFKPYKVSIVYGIKC